MKILIAEDDIISRTLLEESLDCWGYEVISTENGDQAWDAVRKEKPDIAILDWMMPGLNGIDVCQNIRNAENLHYIYIIMLSAKGKDEDVLTGYMAGADNYMSKPFNCDILRSRLAVGSRVIMYDRELTKKNKLLLQYSTEMGELAEERSKQLVHAERMATVGLLSAGIAHEINNPTAFISGNIQTLEKFCKDLKSILRADSDEDKSLMEKKEFIIEEMPNAIKGIRNGVERISKIVNGLKAFCRKDHGDLGVCDVNACIERSLELCRNALKYHVTVEKKLTNNLPQIKADSQQIEQVLVNLFTNAADAITEEEGTVTIETRVHDDAVLITIADNGTGIDNDKLDDIWQPFFTTKPVGSGTGLGLSTVIGIIENHDGKIQVENKLEGGALFTISLPACFEGEKNES